MGVTQNILDSVKTASLNEFSTATHIGWGSSNQGETPTDTDLITPIIRKAFDEAAVQNNTAGTFDFSATLGLTEANGNTLRELGLFNAGVAGDIFIRKLLPVDISKTAVKEVSASIRLSVTVTEV